MNLQTSVELLHLVLGQPEPGAPAPMSGLMSMAPLMIMFIAIMYFLTIRPQQKRDKERQEMLNSLSKGDEVITTGGICGRVVGLKEAHVDLQVGKDVTIKFARGSVAQVVKSGDEAKS